MLKSVCVGPWASLNILFDPYKMNNQPGRAVPTFVHLCFTLSDKTMDSNLH